MNNCARLLLNKRNHERLGRVQGGGYYQKLQQGPSTEVLHTPGAQTHVWMHLCTHYYQYDMVVTSESVSTHTHTKESIFLSILKCLYKTMSMHMLLCVRACVYALQWPQTHSRW